jgi:hypothetical protein
MIAAPGSVPHLSAPRQILLLLVASVFGLTAGRGWPVVALSRLSSKIMSAHRRLQLRAMLPGVILTYLVAVDFSEGRNLCGRLERQFCRSGRRVRPLCRQKSHGTRTDIVLTYLAASDLSQDRSFCTKACARFSR